MSRGLGSALLLIRDGLHLVSWRFPISRLSIRAYWRFAYLPTYLFHVDRDAIHGRAETINHWQWHILRTIRTDI